MTQKMIIFWFIFDVIFCFHFQALLQKCSYCQHMWCNLSTCLLCHQRQRKVPYLNHSLYLPQNELKNLHQRLSSLLPLTPLMMRTPLHSCNQLRSTISPGWWPGPRTEWLLDWLEENPVDQHKLFSGSMKDVKDEGQRKHVVKGTKSEFHKLIAIFVFSVDADKDVWDDFAANAGNYTKSVDNYLGQ